MMTTEAEGGRVGRLHRRIPALLSLAAGTLLVGCHVAEPAPALPGGLISKPAGQPHRSARAAWQRWGEANLQSGDLLFVLGESRILLGLVNFSQLSSQLADSPFSHIALAAWEDGQLLVYDTVADGPRRTPWQDFITDPRLSRWAVKRPRPELRQHVPAAIAYCRQAWQQGIAFDEQFRLDNDRLYCSELIELAYAEAGLSLSEPVPIEHLPGYPRVPAAKRELILRTAAVQPQQPVYLPGNESLGQWSSPHLELVLDATELNAPPAGVQL